MHPLIHAHFSHVSALGIETYGTIMEVIHDGEITYVISTNLVKFNLDEITIVE